MKILIVSIVAGLVAFAVFVRYLESTSIFHPAREIKVTPELFDLEFDDVYFKTADGVEINGWFIKSPGASEAVIYFHGNAGNIGDRLEKVSQLIPLGVSVFLFDYRGYGKSQGAPSEKGLYLDAAAAYDYLLTRVDVKADKIIAYGASLGGVVAIDLCTKRKLAGLIVDSSFTSAADMSKTIFPFVPPFLLKTKMDSISKIKDIKIPKLFLHSPDDEVVPFALGKKLFAAAPAPKEFLEMKGRHNDNYIESQELWIKGLDKLFRSLR